MTSYKKILILLVSLSFIIPISSAVGPIPDTTETYPSWSPDGQKILFDSTGVMSEGLFIVKPDGSEIQKITSEEWDPSWSPDGTKIVVVKNFYNGTDSRNGSYDVALFDIKTKIVTRLTDNANSLKENVPKFSPDGKQIVFEGDTNSGSNVYVMDSNGTGLIKIAESARFPEWSPDGKKIVYYYYKPFSVWVVNSDGTDKKKIIDDYRYEISGNFRWTKDSKYLLLNNDTNRITKVNTDDPTDIEYIYDPVAHWDPEYSPDGTFVTFVSNMDGGDYDLFVARSNGSEVYNIVFDTNLKPPVTPDYFNKKSRPTPPPWPTPSPTVVKTSTATPTAAGTTTQTPSVPGFTFWAGFAVLTLLILIKRIKR